MSRRTLPGADELFRSTGAVRAGSGGDTAVLQAPMAGAAADDARVLVEVDRADDGSAPGTGPDDGVRAAARRQPRPVGGRRPSGRQRHDEKITVYVSGDELLDLEHARLQLRGEHGLAIDRGRIVREALAVVLADLDAKGEASILVRRLRSR